MKKAYVLNQTLHNLQQRNDESLVPDDGTPVIITTTNVVGCDYEVIIKRIK